MTTETPAPSHPHRQHLFVLAEQRTGSNLLGDLLSQLDQIGSMGEILNSNQNPQVLETAGEKALLKVMREIVEARQAEIRGGKLMFEHLEQRNLDLIDVLEQFENPKVLVLFRRDLLAQYVSLVRAKITGEWTASDANRDRKNVDEIIIRPKEFAAFARRSRRRYTSAFDALRSAEIPFEVIEYDELVDDPESIFGQLLPRIVGVDAPPPRPRIQKQRRRALDDVVADPDLLARLQKTSVARHGFATSLETELVGAEPAPTYDPKVAYTRLASRLGWLPGHFYSPYPDLGELAPRYQQLADPTIGAMAGIDLATDRQLQHINELVATEAPSLADLGYPSENMAYRAGDALVLVGELHHRPPSKVVEIGSGYSTALIQSVRNFGLIPEFDHTVVDRYPEKIHELLSEEPIAGLDLMKVMVQDLDASLVEELGGDDILFIDSSHVSKPGSDVNHLVFEWLPKLASGVRVHFHDIQFPFESRWDWIAEGRAWTESYLLRAFLAMNDHYEILLFTDQLTRRHARTIEKLGPEFERSGSSLWIQRR